jgi:hypothetical protein
MNASAGAMDPKANATEAVATPTDNNLAESTFVIKNFLFKDNYNYRFQHAFWQLFRGVFLGFSEKPGHFWEDGATTDQASLEVK